MPRYRYVAVDPEGTTHRGEVDISELEAVLGRAARGWKILDVQEVGGAASPAERPRQASPSTASSSVSAEPETPPFWARSRVPSRVVATFLQQLGMALKNGVSPGQAIHLLAQESEFPQFQRVVEQILDDITMRGRSLYLAMARHPKVFPATCLMLVRSGEEGGDVAGRLERASDLIMRSSDREKEVRRALSGPMVTASMGIVMLFAVVRFVVPQILQLYNDMDADLPWISRLCIMVVHILNHPLTLVGLGVTAIGVYVFRSTLREMLFETGLLIPGVGELLGSFLGSQFCEVLAYLYRDGIPIGRAIGMLEKTAEFKLHARYLRLCRKRLENSGSLSEAVCEIPYFPRMLHSLAAVAEETGSTDTLFATGARMMEEEVELVLTQLVTIIEPVTVCVLGVATGFFFIGLFLPVYGILSKLGG
ncbi:MAG: type II secretion system F family protein [Vulcanimicrobiota bacterium]